MANNALAYGLAKSEGIDTTGMSPKEVWDALAKKGLVMSEGSPKAKEVNEIKDKPISELREMSKPTNKQVEAPVSQKEIGEDLGTKTISNPNEIEFGDGQKISFRKENGKMFKDYFTKNGDEWKKMDSDPAGDSSRAMDIAEHTFENNNLDYDYGSSYFIGKDGDKKSFSSMSDRNQVNVYSFKTDKDANRALELAKKAFGDDRDITVNGNELHIPIWNKKQVNGEEQKYYG